jgi:hypothetical protein
MEMEKIIYKQLYLFFIRKIAHHLEELSDFDTGFLKNLKDVLFKVGQVAENDHMREDQALYLFFYPLMTVKIEVLMDSMCKVSDFYRDLQVTNFIKHRFNSTCSWRGVIR